MRVSSYNIYVKLEENPKYYFLIQGYTGAIDLVSKELTLILRNFKENSLLKEIDKETVELLTTRGYLTEKTKEEETDHLKELVNYIFVNKKIKRPIQNSFLFAVTQNCNFRCPYCYENKISNYGKNWEKQVFTKDLVDKAYEVMELIQPDRERILDSIGLYGGEPLMKENYEIVEYIVKKGQEKGYSFRATTNCYDLDHFKDLLGKDKIDIIHVSVDGPKETHNKRRKHYKDKDTFTKIMDNFSLALDKGVIVRNRINLDKSNFSEVEELMQFYRERGFLDKRNFNCYLARIIDHDKVCHDSSIEIHCADFYEKGQNLKKKNPKDNTFKVSDYNLKEVIKGLIKGDNLFTPKINYCGANNGMFILDPFGDIYTCWEKLGIKSHRVGTFSEGLNYDVNVLNAWHGRTVAETDQCSKCKYALWCGGGCAGMMKPSEDINLNRSNCQEFPIFFAKIINEYYSKEIHSKIGQLINTEY